MNRTRIVFVAGVLSLFVAVAVRAGGWAIVTVDAFPERLVAGESFPVKFSVRQHGMTLTNGLKPMVYAKGPGKTDLRIPAVPAGRDGEYTFDLKLMQPGEWKIAINSGFLQQLTGSRTETTDSPPPLLAGYVELPLSVVDERAAPAVMTETQRGERLFKAKGCAGCHDGNVAPDFAGKRLAPDYVRRVVADPDGTLTKLKNQFPQMPNLKLTPTEINALAVFLSGDPAKTRAEAVTGN